jgi:catechol 2,3-dioxygenase-like lactoylglutathione lyase family enzyme
VSEPGFPNLQQIVLDSTDARRLAEFYRALLGYRYRGGDEPPPAGVDDPQGRDWLVLAYPSGAPRIAFQQVAELPRSTWPGAGIPQQLHLDLTVPDVPALRAQHERALELGARLLLDRSDDPVEQLFVYADPDGHPFCIFVAADIHGLRWSDPD